MCKAGQFSETRWTLDHVCTLEHPVNHLILEDRSLDLTHGVRILQVRASHLIRIGVIRGNVVEPRVHPLPVYLEVGGANNLTHDQSERHPAPCRLLEAAACG